MPKEDVTKEELLSLIDRSEQGIAQARQLERGCWFKHFAFGILDRDKSLKLLRIHNRHHLRIIADILAVE